MSLPRLLDDGKGCLDSLYIKDLDNSTLREFILCGSLSDFILILSNHITLDLDISSLQQEMPEMLGFKMLYEALGMFPYILFAVIKHKKICIYSI